MKPVYFKSKEHFIEDSLVANKPFCKGDWVTLTSRSHPMYGKRAVVLSCTYEGDGSYGKWVVCCIFENSLESTTRGWVFCSTDLSLAVAAEIAGPFRKDLNL